MCFIDLLFLLILPCLLFMLIALYARFYLATPFSIVRWGASEFINQVRHVVPFRNVVFFFLASQMQATMLLPRLRRNEDVCSRTSFILFHHKNLLQYLLFFVNAHDRLIRSSVILHDAQLIWYEKKNSDCKVYLHIATSMKYVATSEI